MKKVLFASTALVAAGMMMSAGAAQASDKIKLDVGGFSKWWVVGAWQDSNFEKPNAGTQTIAQNNKKFVNANVSGDNEIWFSGSTTLDNGLKAGVFFSLEAGGHTDMTTDTIDSSYAWVEGGFGKVLLGTAANGTALLHVQAPDAAANWGAGGVMTGNFAIAKPISVMGMNEIGGYSASINTTAIITDNKAEKITYVAPSFYGLTVGGSYVPNAFREDSRGITARGASAYGAGALYANTFGPVGVKASAGYVTVPNINLGNSIAGTGQMVKGWQQQAYGAQLSYAGFTLGGSYQLGNQAKGQGGLSQSVAAQSGASGVGKTLTTANPGLDFGGQAYDVGLQYANGPYAVSFDYFRSEVNGLMNFAKKDIIEFYQASGKYNLGPGVDVLATVGHADYKDQRHTVSGDGLENSGWTGMTGLSLTF
jgi:hypothetical protein